MAFVITDLCAVDCQMECVSVCPVDCIHGPIPGPDLEAIAPVDRALRHPGLQLYIDPETCICCGACAPECPVDSIFDEDDVPARYSHATARNAAFFRQPRGPAS